MKVKTGDRIRLINMANDPDPIPTGSEGIVTNVSTGLMAQIDVEWIGINRSLSLIPGIDSFEIIESANCQSGTKKKGAR